MNTIKINSTKFTKLYSGSLKALTFLILVGCLQTKEVIVEVPVSSPQASYSVKTKVYEAGTQVYFENKYRLQVKKSKFNQTGKVVITSTNGSQLFLSASLDALASKTSISLNTSEYTGPLKVKLISNGSAPVSKIVRFKYEGINELVF